MAQEGADENPDFCLDRDFVLTAPIGQRLTARLKARIPGKEGLTAIATTVGIIVVGIVLTLIFQDDINSFGVSLIESAGQEAVDVVLFSITAVSSTILMLPIWGYALAGIAMGYHVVRLAVVMALGSATGSLTTLLIGRYFSERSYIKRKFPNLEEHPWTAGKSRLVVTWILFIGTASPIPCDVLYLACGAKRYPIALFWPVIAAGRVVRYLYLGYGFSLVLS